MSFTFDGDKRLCILDAGTTDLDVKLMYSRWKEWQMEGDNLKYTPFLRVVGGDPTVGSNSISNYFFSQNGWKIQPQSASHVLTITGILNTDNVDGEKFEYPVGSFRIVIQQVIPLQAETITVDSGGSSTGPTASQVASAVWSHPWALTVAKFLGLK